MAMAAMQIVFQNMVMHVQVETHIQLKHVVLSAETALL